MKIYTDNSKLDHVHLYSLYCDSPKIYGKSDIGNHKEEYLKIYK